MTVSVLAITLMSPVSMFLMSTLGPRLLTKSDAASLLNSPTRTRENLASNQDLMLKEAVRQARLIELAELERDPRAYMSPEMKKKREHLYRKAKSSTKLRQKDINNLFEINVIVNECGNNDNNNDTKNIEEF